MLDFATEDALSQLEPGAFKKEAVFFPSMDYMDYLRCDGVHVAQRIDRFLTLIWDRNQEEVVGFRLKGIHNFFLKRLKPVHHVQDDAFVLVKDLFLIAMNTFGDDLFSDDAEEDEQKHRWAYDQAIEIANNDSVTTMKMAA